MAELSRIELQALAEEICHLLRETQAENDPNRTITQSEIDKRALAQKIYALLKDDLRIGYTRSKPRF